MFSDADVAELAPMADAVEALERAFVDVAEGRARTMSRTRVIWEGGRLQALGGYVQSGGCAAVKSWLVTESGARPTVIVFSVEDGSVVALMEAAELGRIRTGAASAVATRYLSPPDASTLLVVGTGRQAFAQVAAIAVVRPLQRVLVAGRDAERTAAFAARITSALGVEARAVASVAEGASEASIITTITNAREPILNGQMLPRSVHVNAVGAVVPGSREVDSSVFAGADLVVCDSIEQAREESSELEAAVADGSLRWHDLVELSELVSGATSGNPGGRTVFKSLGVGLEDVAVAALVWRRGLEPG